MPYIVHRRGCRARRRHASPSHHGCGTRAKKRRLEQEEEEEHVADWISTLPDNVLVDIVSLLPTKDGARTQLLSSRWRHLWRSAPLNLDLQDVDSNHRGILASDKSDILSAHPGPCRRFVMPRLYRPERPTASTTMFGWLWSPALDNLQELVIPCDWYGLLLPSVHRFSPTLCAARFIDCSFPTPGGIGKDAGAGLFHWPLLKHLTLFRVTILERSLLALLAGCPVLESLLLLHCSGFDRLQIVSHSLRSIGVHSSYFFKCSMHQLVIEDAPRLERLLYFRGTQQLNISVISAPRLAVLGKLFDSFPRLQFGSTVFQGSSIVSMPGAVVSSVKVLALNDVKFCLDAVINLLQCFPQLQKLHIKIKCVLGKDWCTNRKHTSTLDIGLRKIVLRNYRGYKSHINLARFFVSNARLLESMRFEIEGTNISTSWIRKQKRLLQIKKSASGAQFDFVSPSLLIRSLEDHRVKQMQDLSADPFDKFLY